ncbi:putative glutathione s-transferase, partial [Ascodesmis nigricans]
LEQSRADRIIWILEELNLPYQIQAFKRKSRLAPPEAKQIHPLGKFPMISLNSQTIAESGLIIELLIEQYGSALIPETAEEKMKVRYFNYYAEGSFMTPMVVGVVLNSIRSAPVPFFLKPVVKMIANKVEEGYLMPQYTAHLDFLEGELEGRRWIAGDTFTGADVMMGWPLMAAKARVPGYTREAYPNLFAYLDRLGEREAFKRTRVRVEELEAQIGGKSKL